MFPPRNECGQYPLDLDASQRYQRYPLFGNARFPYPALIGWISGMCPFLDYSRFMGAVGKTSSGPWTGKTLPSELAGGRDLYTGLKKVRG